MNSFATLSLETDCKVEKVLIYLMNLILASRGVENCFIRHLGFVLLEGSHDAIVAIF